MRKLLLTAIALLLLSPALASAQGGKLLGLRQVEEAFFKAGIPFRSDWQYAPPNPYLYPPANSSPRLTLPTNLQPHLTGWAYGVNPTTLKGGIAWVFDSVQSATGYMQWCHGRCASQMLSRADNVVYSGTRSAKAVQVMAKLRQG